MFKEYYEKLNTLNEEKLTEWDDIAAEFAQDRFWKYANKKLISYKDFYEGYSWDIRILNLEWLFDADHKLINKEDAYNKIKELTDKYPKSSFGKALLRLWTLQFEDKAETVDEFRKRKEEESALADRQMNEKIREVINYLIDNDTEIESQCFEAAKIIVQDKDTIRLVELIKWLDKYYSWTGNEAEYDLTNLDNWCYKSKVENSDFIINFRFGRYEPSVFRAPRGSLSKYNYDERKSYFLHKLFDLKSVYDSGLKEARNFKELLDSGKLKEILIEKIRKFIQDLLPWYEYNKNRIEAEEKAKKAKEEARIKLIALINHGGKNFNSTQLNKINEIFNSLIKKWKDHIAYVSDSWAGSTDGSQGAAVHGAIRDAYNELAMFLGKINWAAFDENNKLIAEFDPTRNNANELNDALSKLLSSKQLYFSFSK